MTVFCRKPYEKSKTRCRRTSTQASRRHTGREVLRQNLCEKSLGKSCLPKLQRSAIQVKSKNDTRSYLKTCKKSSKITRCVADFICIVWWVRHHTLPDGAGNSVRWHTFFVFNFSNRNINILQKLLQQLFFISSSDERKR